MESFFLAEDLGNLPQEDLYGFPKQKLEYVDHQWVGENNVSEVLSRIIFLLRGIETSLMLR